MYTVIVILISSDNQTDEDLDRRVQYGQGIYIRNQLTGRYLCLQRGTVDSLSRGQLSVYTDAVNTSHDALWHVCSYDVCMYYR